MRKGALVCLLLIAWVLFSYRGHDRRSVLGARVYAPVHALPVVLPTPFPYPRAIDTSPAPPITARASIVMDVTTAAVLTATNPTTRVKPASTTKIMTALVALKRCDLQKIAVVKTLDTNDIDTQMGLSRGEEITVESLLYGLLLNSGNDAAIVLSENCAENTTEFVRFMNEEATAVHLSDSHFVNPTGLDDPDHYTTAQDLARLTAVVMRNPTFARIVKTKEIQVSDISHARWHTLKNKNLLLEKLPNVIGVKTGWTEEAGECLVAAVTHQGNTLVSVVLGSSDRFGESEALINWALSHYHWDGFSS